MDCDYHDPIVLLEIDVDNEHPAPWTKDDAEAAPSSIERGADQREGAKRSQRPGDSLTGVARQAVGADQPVEVLGGCGRDLNPWHGSELIDRNRAAFAGLCEPELGAFVGPGDPVE